MEVQSLKQLLAWQPPQTESIIGNGILLPQTRMVIYGLWKSWKSMFAQHTGFCLASGIPWLDFETSASSVLTVQLEIPKAVFRKRVEKYAQGNNLFPANLYYISQHYLKLDREFGFAALDRAVSIVRPDVLIIDPVYKVLSGNISDSYDMMKLLDNLDNLIDKHQIAIILVTHTRKPIVSESGEVVDRGLEDIMGSSYLPNWLDSAVGMKVIGQDLVQLSFTALRHAEEEVPAVMARISRQTLKFTKVQLTVHRLGE